MRVINKTHYRTEHLRSILKIVAKDEMEFAKADRKRCVVTFKYKNRMKWHQSGEDAGCSGFAYYHGNMTVRLPKENVDKVDLAHTIAHELAHVRGLRHAQMKGARYARVGDWRERYAWATYCPLEIEPPSTKLNDAQKEARTAERVAKFEAYVTRWTRKVKLANTKLKLWTRKLKRARAAQAKAAQKRGTNDMG